MNAGHAHLDPALATLSAVIAVLASYTALDLAARARADAASGTARHAWTAAAAVAMGGGILGHAFRRHPGL